MLRWCFSSVFLFSSASSIERHMEEGSRPGGTGPKRIADSGLNVQVKSWWETSVVWESLLLQFTTDNKSQCVSQQQCVMWKCLWAKTMNWIYAFNVKNLYANVSAARLPLLLAARSVLYTSSTPFTGLKASSFLLMLLEWKQWQLTPVKMLTVIFWI